MSALFSLDPPEADAVGKEMLSKRQKQVLSKQSTMFRPTMD